MGLFSLLFRKNNSLIKDKNLNNSTIETIETISSKIEVVYPSGMLFKTVDSYTPKKDIMDVIVPIAMNIFGDNYTVYFTEKLLSESLSKFNLNINLRKEIYLICNEKSLDHEAFKNQIIKEIEFLDILFVNKVIDGDMAISTYIKIRETLLEGFKFAGNTDLYFKAIYNILNLRFLKYKDVDVYISEMKSIRLSECSNIDMKSKFLFIDKPNVFSPCKDIMIVINEHLESLLSKMYDYKSIFNLLSNVINSLKTDIENGIESYDNLTAKDYLYEVKKSIVKIDYTLINMIKDNKIDETIYLTIQEVLIKSFMEAKVYDFHFEVIFIILNDYIEENLIFKDYISNKITDFFSET